jgi:hypothetical protein
VKARPFEVQVNDPHSLSQLGKSNSEVGCDGAFSCAAFE